MRKTLFLLLFLASYSWCFPQNTISRIKNYTPKDYGRGREALNYVGVQDKTGVLYFGNAGGLLRYDGEYWSYIPVKNQSVWVRSLAVSPDNTIYVGAQGEFGYLSADQSGKMYYVSLSDSLPENKAMFSDIICVCAWNKNVAFQSEEAIFLYSQNQLTVLYPETSFHVSFLVDNELYVRERGLGIMKLKDQRLELIEGSGFLKDFGVFSILESSDRNRLLVLTREIGFWSVDKETFNGKLIKTADSAIFRRSSIYGAIRLNDGKIAVNTLSDGVIFADDSFRILSIINKDNGLKVNVTNSLLQDYQGNIWASLDNGIAQIFYSSPLSLFGPESGLPGNVRTIIRYNGNLFVGTSEGLFVQSNNFRIQSTAFIPFKNLKTDIRSLCIANDCLIAVTRDGLFEIRENQIRKIYNGETRTAYYSEKLKILFAATKDKLSLYEFLGEWRKLRDLPEITEEVVRFEEEVNDDNVTLWLGTSLQGIVRLQFTIASDIRIDKYDSFDGLIDNDWAIPFKIDNRIVFSQRNGLLSFIDEKTIRQRLPDSLRNRPEFFRGYFDLFSFDTVNKRITKPFYVIEDTGERIYVNLDGDLGYFDKTDSYRFVDKPFRVKDIGKITVIYNENNGFCWIGGDDGLLLYDENGFKDYSIDFNSIITGVSAGTRDSTIFYGYSSDILPARKSEIRFNLNTLTFTYAAPFFEGQDKMLYSYLLSGQDTSYSSWSADNRVIFRNLWEGDYTFRVRAMNIYGHISAEDSYEFRILSPWYRKSWAILLYVLLLIASVYAVIRIYARRLIAKNKRLEAIIRARTREIQEKNIELQMQKEDILASINYAQRIQNAVLPSEELIQKWLGDHFVIFRPKDIVSGDFYWTNVCDRYVVFCVADCTGHGVPGAFMSMMCISFLNEIVIKEKVFHAEQILNKVREMIIESLKQKGVRGEQKDGMDIALCVYNKDTSEIEFAGANNPLYIIRENNKEPISSDRQFENENHILYEIKGERMPISIFDTMEPFNSRIIKIRKDDRLYMFSDGVCDQFGGPSGRKFTNKALISSLFETLTPQIKDQKALLEKRIDHWQSYIDPRTSHPYSQIDDICLMGIII
jgi:serine phosphatase RsbU (regulator of sigma subunit)/ligand-binding sensor domain-containing protein